MAVVSLRKNDFTVGFATLMQRQAAPFPPASPKEREEGGRTETMRNSKQWSINLESGATDKINAIGDAHRTTDDDDK